jgi:hypothetical protein
MSRVYERSCNGVECALCPECPASSREAVFEMAPARPVRAAVGALGGECRGAWPPTRAASARRTASTTGGHAHWCRNVEALGGQRRNLYGPP